MAMTKMEFNQAFHDAFELEFSNIPTNESAIDYTFSDEFLRKMDTLIASQKKTSWNLIYFAKRHVVMIAIVMLGLFATACGVTQIVKYLHHDIYKEVRQELIEIGGGLDITAEFHSLGHLPEGFEKTGINKRDGYRCEEYKNERGHELEFMQDKTGETYIILGEELVTRETVAIDGKTVELFKNNWLIGAMWVEDGIYMEILYYGGTDMEELKDIVEGVN